MERATDNKIGQESSPIDSTQPRPLALPLLVPPEGRRRYLLRRSARTSVRSATNLSRVNDTGNLPTEIKATTVQNLHAHPSTEEEEAVSNNQGDEVYDQLKSHQEVEQSDNDYCAEHPISSETGEEIEPEAERRFGGGEVVSVAGHPRSVVLLGTRHSQQAKYGRAATVLNPYGFISLDKDAEIIGLAQSLNGIIEPGELIQVEGI